MKKILFIFIISLSSLNAEYLMTYGSTDYCIDSYTVVNQTQISIVLSSNGSTYLLSLTEDDISAGYIYVNGQCVLDTNKPLGLLEEDYNFMYAMLGLFFGMILFWIVPK